LPDATWLLDKMLQHRIWQAGRPVSTR